MFDDIPLKNQGTVPSNLPVAEPEDMFSDERASDTASVPSDAAAEDVAPPSALSAGVLQPKMAPTPTAPVENTRFRTPTPIATMPQGVSPTASEIEVNQGSSLGHIVVTVVIIVLIIGIFGVGGWYVYGKFFAPGARPAPVVTPVPGTTNVPVTPATPAASTTNNTSISDQLLFGGEVDSDADGLSDTREAQIGTDSNNWDTDGDGLSDYNEIVVWKTDPHNVDTDGDGFKDGQEVTNGYNPAGPGKIFQPPSTTTSIIQ